MVLAARAARASVASSESLIVLQGAGPAILYVLRLHFAEIQRNVKNGENARLLTPFPRREIRMAGP